jgi:hypothetical protein
VPVSANVICPENPISISADGNYLAVVAGEDLYLFNPPKTREPVWTKKTWGIPCVSLSSDGSRLAIGGAWWSPIVFAPVENTSIWSYEADSLAVSLSPDGRYLATGTFTYNADLGKVLNKIYFFDIDNNVLIWSYELSDESPWGFSVSENGIFILASTSYHIYLFTKYDNEPIWSYEATFASVSLSADGHYIVIWSSDGVYVFTQEDNVPVRSYPWAQTASISADGNYIAVSSPDTIYLISLKDNAILWSCPLKISYLSISSGGDKIAARDTTDVYLFTRDSSSPIWSYSFKKPTLWDQISFIIVYLVFVLLGVAACLVLIKKLRKYLFLFPLIILTIITFFNIGHILSIPLPSYWESWSSYEERIIYPIVVSFIAAVLTFAAGLILAKRSEKFKFIRWRVPDKFIVAFTLAFIVMVSVMHLVTIRIPDFDQIFTNYKIVLVCCVAAFWGSAVLLLRPHRPRFYWALFLTALFFSVLTVVEFSLFLRNYPMPY